MYGFRFRTMMPSIFVVVLMLAAIVSGKPAAAADFASGCCEGLEDRVAELESTVARKGNRNVSLQIYGQVNKALLIWDDGIDRDAFVVDNSTSSSRVGLIGEGKIKPGWFAGYRIELEMKDAASDEVFNDPNGDEGVRDGLLIRHNYVYVESEKLGRISIGQQSPATDDITIINLGVQMSNAALEYNNNFGLRLDFGGGTIFTTDRKWGYFAHTVDTLRGDYVRYDSPAIRGFVLSAAAGENDAWDVALRYRADWNSIRVAAGIGYMDAPEIDVKDLRGSFSVLHTPTGLFLSGAGGMRDDDFPVTGDDPYFWFAQAGLKRRFFGYGDTTLYGEYGIYKNYSVGRLIQADLTPEEFTTWGKISDSEIRRFGFGVEQAVDSAGLLLYAQYQLFDANIFGNQCTIFGSCPDFLDEVTKLPVQDWSAVVVGTRIQF